MFKYNNIFFKQDITVETSLHCETTSDTVICPLLTINKSDVQPVFITFGCCKYENQRRTLICLSKLCIDNELLKR
mgnify:CR=1 FL=1